MKGIVGTDSHGTRINDFFIVRVTRLYGPTVPYVYKVCVTLLFWGRNHKV